MRATKPSRPIVIFLLLLLLLAPYSAVSARSVHQTNAVEIFPQGEFTQPLNWTSSAFTAFSDDNLATYTEAMVADQRLTMVHHRPLHQDSMTFWAQSTSTNHNNSMGSPDGATSWSTGPEIKLSSFNAFGSTDYDILAVDVVVAFSVPDPLYQDSVRISLNYDGQYEPLATFSHTQGPLDYLSDTWEYNASNLTTWDWNMIQNSEITLDYVSVGGLTDDSQLNVDAVGMQVTMKTPWYGNEYGSAHAQFSGHEMPVIGMDFMLGTSDNMALAECGLKSSIPDASGLWTSEIIETPPNQRIGRVHYTLENESLDDVNLEYSFSDDGESFSEFTLMDENMLLPDHSFTQLRISTIAACITTLTVDVNDPTLSLQGRVFGDIDGLNLTRSRWVLYVNDEWVSNQPVLLSPSLALSIPIGKYMNAGDTTLKVELRTWFSWESNGNVSTTALEVTSVTVSGGYELEWDEDPVCIPVGDQYLTEDGGGRILPFLYRCTDDRTPYENLEISFSNTNPELVVVDLTEGDIRLSLQPESSGQATIQTTVTDAAGNIWVETFITNVQNVDDTPVLQEFQSLVPVELSVPTEIPFDYADVDSSSLTVSSNRSWVTVDLINKTMTVNAQSPGFTSILISLCDQTSCHERILDLEVLALPDLYVEEIDLGDDVIRSGDIVSIRVLIRNDGQADASLISVRCESNSELIDFQTLPLLQPGKLAYVTCDWQVPEDKEQVQIRAVIDRGLEIKEGREDNNEGLIAVTIEPQLSSFDANSNSNLISDEVFWGLSVVVFLAIICTFVFLTPAKIKKLE